MVEDELSERAAVRGTRRRVPPEVPAVNAHSRASTVVHAAIATSVRTLVTHETRLRDAIDDVAVHQARVATRRLRSDLRTFSPLLEPAWSRWTADELRWLGARLGEARDADVLLGRIRGGLDRLPDAGIESRELLLAPLVSRRQAARRNVRDTLRAGRYAELVDTLAAAAEAPPLLPAARAPAANSLPRLVEQRWNALRRTVRMAGPAPVAGQLHTIRIRVKRVRYASEAISPALGTPARRFARRMEDLQELLGRHHDATVAAAWLRDAARGAPPEVAFLAGELTALQQAEVAGVEAGWPKRWRSSTRPRHRSWL